MHQLFPLRRDRDPKPFAKRPRHDIRAIFGAAVVASILTLAVGCNKKDAEEPTGTKYTSLAGKPKTLMFVFGDRMDPRVLPIATLVNGQINQITLDSTGWHNFDHIYFPAGARLTAYVGGLSIGDAVIRRGMWDESEPLYKLPNCRWLRPLAAATVDSAPANVMLELFATSDPLAVPPVRAAQVPADVDSARALAIRVAQHEGLTNSARSELDEMLNTFYTGVTPHPTVIGSYLERGSGVNGKPRHVFVIGDYNEEAKGYVQSFSHVAQGDTREFRRLIDHLDLTGDGVDEIVLEGWRTPGGDSFLVFLGYHGGHWRELARSATSWCADPGKA